MAAGLCAAVAVLGANLALSDTRRQTSKMLSAQ